MIRRIVDKYRRLPVQVRASFWFLICSFLQRGISVITTPIFTRILTASEYGDYNVFNSWLGIVTIFTSLRLYYGVYSQGLVKFEDERNLFSSSMQGLLFSLVTGWTTIYLIFHRFFNHLFSLTTLQGLAMFAMIWATGAFSFWAAEQRVIFSYRRLVLVTIIVSIAKPVLSIIFILNSEDKVTARILGLMFVELIGYSWCFVMQMVKGKNFFSAKFWKYALLFNIPLVPHYLSQTVLNSADRIMIRDMIGSKQAGIYSLTYSISQIMMLFNQALIQTLTPWIYQKIKADKPEEVPRLGYIALVLIGTVNLILIILAPEVVAIFAPATYYEAIWIIPPVALSGIFVFAYNLFSAFEFYFEKTKFIMAASVAGAVLNVVLNYIFINIFGYYAAGYTTLACYIIYALGHYYNMQRICRDNFKDRTIYDTKILTAIAIAFLVCGFVFLSLYKLPVIRYGVVLVGTVILAVNSRKILMLIRQIFDLRKKKEAGGRADA